MMLGAHFFILAQASTVDPWQAVLSGGGVVSLVLLFLWGFKMEWWVQGGVMRRRDREYEELVKRHEAYRDKVEERMLPLLHDYAAVTRELMVIREVTSHHDEADHDGP